MTGPAIDLQIPEAFDFLFDPPLGAVRYRGAYGGRGKGASWSFARAVLTHGSQQALRILCAREFMSSLRDSVHQLLTDQIDLMRLGRFYRVQETAIYGINGTEFLFKGLKRDINQIKSLERINLVWIEEAQSVSENSWKVLTPTIREPGSEIWATWNPALETDPTHQRLVVKPPPRSIIRKVGYLDNPWLPDVLDEEQRELAKNDPEAHAHIWGGELWTRSDAEVLSGKWRVEEFTPSPHWQGPYFGGDYGFARDPAMLAKLWIADGRLYLEHEAGGVQLDMDQLYRAWSAVPDAARYTIRADAARPETTNELRRRGLRVESAPKWSGSVEDGIEHLRSYEAIVIHPRCKVGIREARLWRYKTDPRTGDVLPALQDGNEHVWDATRYALAPLIKQGARPRFSVA